MSTQTISSKLVRTALLVAVVAGGVIATAQTADAATYRRQYYSNWNHHPTNNYHYCRYYYTPVVTTHVTTVKYEYHYVITYPSQPQYRYYYNPVRRVYWGRFEVDENNKPVGYSLLANEDRKSSLKDIPESAFPPASKMPPVPGSKDGEAMAAPPLAPADLPNS